MADLRNEFACCGINELDGVSGGTPEDVLGELLDGCGIPTTRHIIFTDITQHQRRAESGWAFAAYIKANGLGVVTGPTPTAVNPSSRNRVVVWVWTPNVKAITKWWKKNEKPYYKRLYGDDYDE